MIYHIVLVRKQNRIGSLPEPLQVLGKEAIDFNRGEELRFWIQATFSWLENRGFLKNSC